MASSSLFSSPIFSSPSSILRYDLYLSFHGADVPRSFLAQILKDFRSKGVDSFINGENERLNSFDLIEAIRDSRISFVILSTNYASSVQCLDELVEIIKCREELGQLVMAIFYKVDPSDVKKQTGDFGKVFNESCKGKTEEDIARWQQALQRVVPIAGYCSRNWGNDADMITAVSYISNISKDLKSDFKGLVGMETHLKKMEPLLCLKLESMRVIGIWGPPGIGKTAIAKCLYQQYSNQFQFSVFMENLEDIQMRDPTLGYEEYNPRLQLKDHFLSKVVKQNDTAIPHLPITQKMLKDKKVLVVLDDVKSLAQLEALAKETWLFGSGSRIIVVTQDQRLLKTHGINHIYKVDFPPPDEALQIFCRYAFGQLFPFDDFVKLALEVTTLSGQHPLGLRFMGSYFWGMSKEEWTNELPRLKTSLDGELQSIIKFTYDSLSGEDKELSHRHISYLGDDELTKRMDQYLAKQFSEVRQELIIANQDLKEDLGTSERGFTEKSNGLLQSINIYCAVTLHNSFASHLSMEFCRKGLNAFIVCNETPNKIERDSASVVVFSNSCFSSTSYLDNLVRVVQCQRKSGQLIVPVFYGISPSDVDVQGYKSGERKTEWSSALQELRKLPGYQLKEERSECELVEEIVKDMYEKLFPTEKIGINSRLLEIEQLLCKQPWGIRRIGIWGMPGIGKTTLAQAFFDQISGGYEASCFINDFDKAFHEKGLHHMLEEHFGKFLEKLSNKITLVVLDDVHNPLVAESFLRGIHWFGLGSLIIITSRDKQVFRHCHISHVYEVQSLNQNEALQLFFQCAFGKDIREQVLLELSEVVIDYASGNPLALSIYGGELKGKTLSEMVTTFLKLKHRIPNKIHDLFKSSYELLDEREKNIFLDIACFFNGEKVEYVMQLLEGCGFFPHVGIDVLVEKCLVTISENRVRMHRLIQYFGRETVQINKRRRLWEPQTIKYLFQHDKATSTWAMDTEGIEGIFLDASSTYFHVKPTAFEDMLNLRFLKIYYSDYDYTTVRLSKGLESLPNELRLLHWEYYPLQSLPQDFDPCHLVELNMPYSQLQNLWEGTKNLKMLKIVRLCHSQQLTEIDNVCKALNIVLIDLQGCTMLQRFPATSQLQHLRVVNLSGCTKIKSFTEVSPNIEELHLQGTGIRELPTSVGNATHLEILDLSDCSSLAELPCSFGNATNLKKLHLTGCSSLVKLPSSIGNAINLEELNLDYCSSLVELPSSFENATNLKNLYVTGCSRLGKLPSSIRNSTNLKFIDLDEDNNLPIVTVSDNSRSRCVEARCAKGRKLFVLKGERKYEHYVFLSLRTVDENEHVKNIHFSFYPKDDTASTVMSSEMVELFKSTNLDVTFMAELIDIFLVNLIPTWKTEVKVDHLIHSQLNQKEAITQKEKKIAFHNEGDKQCIDAIKVEDRNSNQEAEEATEPVSLKREERLHPKLNEPVRLINWENYPLQSLPQDSDPCHLVELNMPYSQLQKLWGGTKNLKMLKMAKLCHSKQLTEIDDLCKAQNIELIDLRGCTKLHSFPATDHLQHLRAVNLSGCIDITSFAEFSPNIEELHLWGTGIRELSISIGNATRLEILDLSYCSSLVELPSSLGNATNLKIINLKGCSSLVELPTSIGNANKLEILNLCNCSSLLELPSSVGNATNLQYLNLSCCSRLVKLPSSFGNSLNLKELLLVRCSNLVELPTDIGNATKLEVLDLSNCSSLITLPASIGNATNLKNLYLAGCSSLLELPASIGNATNLNVLDLTDCSNLVGLPSSIGNVTNLQILNLENCSKLIKLPWSLGNILNIKELYLAGCSSLVDLPSSIRNSTRLMSMDLNEDNNIPLVTFSDNSGSKCIEVRHTKKRNIFVLKGEQKDEHSVSLNLRMLDGSWCVMDNDFLFYQEVHIASEVSSAVVEKLGLTDEYIAFIAVLIDILLVNMIPNWKIDVAVDHLTHSLLKQYEDKTQGQEETAFHDVCKPVSHPWTSDFPRSDEEDEQYVDDIKVDKSSNQEVEEATEPVSLVEEERLRQELEEIEAKYQEEMQEIMRKREEAMMEAKKKLSLMKKRTT